MRSPYAKAVICFYEFNDFTMQMAKKDVEELLKHLPDDGTLEDIH